MKIDFTIPGRIGGKGRPRFTVPKNGTRPHAYTPEKTVSEAGVIAYAAYEAMKGRTRFEDAVALCVTVSLIPPKSWSAKKRTSAKFVTVKPDADNVLKAICDAFNGIIWTDDAQVSDVYFSRRYSLGLPECVNIIVSDAYDFALPHFMSRAA